MWLIDTRTLRLKLVQNSELHYAILSHTWGDEEVNFKEMDSKAPGRLRKAGWTKIVETCRIARDTFGLDYVWIDTCCIDKSSSAELSEAINSMFTWYKTATVCIVYLEDLKLVPDKRCQPGSTRFRGRLGACRWFTRGWTLQELIAPSEMVFCDGDWVQFGTKDELVSDLSEITGIEDDVLRNVDLLSAAHVGKKMSWAASRQTTRIEDQAYCLLGIFDVHMPLLYGEGEKAFLRLQEEIARSRNDLTLFAWLQDPGQAHGSEFRGIFAASPAEFRHCRKLRVPEEHLQQDVEFSLTNRGLRIDSNVYYISDSVSDLTLALDCLDQFPRTVGMWVHIHLTKIGARYVRARPQDFHYTRTQQYQARVAVNGSPIYIAPTLPKIVAKTMSSRRHLNLVYSQSLRDQVPEQCVAHGRVLRSGADFDRDYAGIISSEEVRRQKGVLKDVQRVWHADLGRNLYTVDRFTSEGLQNDRFCHLFSVWRGQDAPLAQIALVCGLSSINRGGSGSGSARFPWAALLDGERFPDLNDPEDPSSGPISYEQRVRMFHHYIFEQYSDEAGSLWLGDLPTSIQIRDARTKVLSTVNVSIVAGIHSRDSFAIMLSYSKR